MYNLSMPHIDPSKTSRGAQFPAGAHEMAEEPGIKTPGRGNCKKIQVRS